MSQDQEIRQETEPSDVPPDVSSPEPVGSLGSRLRVAREAAGYSIADVVQVIRFSAHQIDALERDDYSALPGATSVRGLVRNYAKFLKVDPVPLLALLEPSVPVPEADVRPPTNMGEAEQAALAERIPLRSIVAVALSLLIALTLYWYLDSPGGGTIVKRPAVVEVPAAKDVAVMAQPGSESAVVVAPGKVVVSESATTVTGGTSAIAVPTGLRLEFDDRSWVEIRDATQRIVLVGEFPAGTRQNVDGKAPFQLWIGRASAVRVFMGERAIDLRPHTREEVARLSLE